MSDALQVPLVVSGGADARRLARMIGDLRAELLAIDVHSTQPTGPAGAVAGLLLAIRPSAAAIRLMTAAIAAWLRRQPTEVTIEIDGQRFSGHVTKAQLDELVAAFIARTAQTQTAPLSDPMPELEGEDFDEPDYPIIVAEPAADIDDDFPWHPAGGLVGALPDPEPSRRKPDAKPAWPRASDLSPKRLLTGSVPARAALGDEISLIVRVVLEDSSNRGPFASALAPFDVSPAGTELTIVLESRAGLAPLGPVQQRLLVPPVGDSAPVRFAIRSTDVGLHDLTVTAWSGGTYVGELDLQVSIGRNTAVVDGGARAADLSALTRRQGEATLQVLVNNGQYMFQLLAGDDLFDTVPGDKLTEDPAAAVQRARDALGRIARGPRASGYTAPNAISLMKALGVGLWDAMIPRELKDQFWSIRDRITMFTIASTMDAVPWELVYPKSPTQDHGFLVEQFPVLRRMHRHRSPRIGLSDARFVVPPGAPSNAEAEVKRIRDVLGVSAEGRTIVDLEQLLGLIDSGDAGLLHFACHNAFDSGAGSAIGMNGGAFIPDLLNPAVSAQALRERAPLVFLNACTSAADVPRYTDMMGFASQFMKAGAGAFVGTLWDVRSEPAGRFAEDFYTRLATMPLGEAAFAARRALRESDSADPTWLAYTIFGDPAATSRQGGTP
ncbi:CHAT domain-containing protein [Asanoa sp. NPDC050611]|uniref:CHAT domain-containing protein n=1 Tax=Asanoa sp. NPDC050611 TaxID=3157098 RepID=UPI0033DDFD58